MLDHFSHSGLACPTICTLPLVFGEALNHRRIELHQPIYIISARRSPMHNTKVCDHPRSLYLNINKHYGTDDALADRRFVIIVMINQMDAI